MGSETIRNSTVGLFYTWATNQSKKSRRNTVQGKVQDLRKNRQTKTDISNRHHPPDPSNGLEKAKGLGVLLPLEPRIMFDGAALLTGAEIAQDQVTHNQDLQEIDANVEPETFPDPFTDSIDLLAALSTVTAHSDRREIVFIDTSVEGYQTLMEGIDPNAEVILLDSTRDGIEQIAEILRNRSDIDAIHIISHGDQGELRLGTGVLNLASMQGDYTDKLAIINQALTEEADFLIYGCNFGEGDSGQEAATLLAELTGADVAASTDLTGSTDLGGDWDLEYATGAIETYVAVNKQAQQSFSSVLATVNVSNTTDTSNGDTSSITNLIASDGGDGISLREAVIAANNTSGTDTIMLLTGNYMLAGAIGENAAASGDLDITDDLAIIGAGSATTIIDGGGNDRVFDVRSGATVTISDLTIQNGNTSSNGGGIDINSGTTLTLSDVIVSGNTSGETGGGISNRGTLSLIDSTISGNSAVWGGGIANTNNLTLERVTIDANMSSNHGGGIYNFAGNTVSLTNVTISGNTSGNNGGGIYTTSLINITNSTITSNLGGAGIHAVGSGNAVLKNTILDNNVGGNANQALTSLGNNIDSDSTAGLGDPLDGVDPMLGALANNGGTTRTHALLGGSPAINAGTAAGAPVLDQRSVTRDGIVDIGAFEFTGNIAPTLDLDADDSSGATGNDYALTFTEGDGPTAIADSDTDLVDLDSLTFASVKLDIIGLLDGNAEVLLLDGSTFALATAVLGQNTIGGNYQVVLATGGGSATLTITKQGGDTFTEIETETLIKAVQYQHTDTSAPTDGDRLIDVTVNDGTTDSAAARTTININPMNDAPVLTSNGGGATATVNAPENQITVTTITGIDKGRKICVKMARKPAPSIFAALTSSSGTVT